MNRKEGKKIAVMTAVIVGFMVIAFIPLASAGVTDFTVTPGTGIAGAVDSYNVLVTTTGVTTINITIPAGFIAVTPAIGGVEIARVDFWNESTKTYYGYATITSNIADPEEMVDIYCEFGGVTATGQQNVDYTPGETSTFLSGIPSDTSSAIIKLPTTTEPGSIKISINCTAFQLEDVHIAIKKFVWNPGADLYTFTTDDGKTAQVHITAPEGRGIIFRDGIWHADTDGDHVTDLIFKLGQAGDLPVVGDINQDGIVDTGIFRPTTSDWRVDTTGDHEADLTFNFGYQDNDRPVVGDINRDGKDDIAVLRAGVWHVATGGPPSSFTENLYFHYGQAGDIPLVGDIDQDGEDDIAIFRIFGTAGAWHIDNTGGPPYKADIIAQYGVDGDEPVVGDIDWDSLDDMAIFRGYNGLGVWHVNTDPNLGSPFVADQIYQYGEPGDLPLAGDIYPYP
jgi:hypothetical protein